ncbi:TIGR03364 family FAD-dependent oxidoreductase [Leucobacter allii]|uniref:TIGR03364 family FAD-dependent oxidoreductase n=1 Tax=Leucobacter allii TaxID=2932247 RepID=UPI001FD03968|nr:TIGR03364 family FAD-dependent oxidoreductase [Leucobacter allii]UOR02217.1 TIGR03364 family FAD-dependent oxidoreductase [Leucobacter allii]
MNLASPPSHVVIVGAGIVGLGHAVAALGAGHRVTVLEQDASAVLASVRNFGHVGASVQAGELAELARASLQIWASLAERAGVEARRSGTLVVARSETEAALLDAFVAERRESGARAELVTGGAAATMLHLDGAAAGAVRAGALLAEDVTADPRTAVARIAAWVGAHERGEVRFRTAVHGVEAAGDGASVATSRGRIPADRVVVAAGHLLGRLFPAIAETGELRECALQMLRVRPPRPMGLGPAVLTGTSMLRYGAFGGPGLAALQAALRAELAAARPELLEIDANVMLTQQADGTLLVGDSHAVHDAAPPFLDERWSSILHDEAAALLGADRLDILERWQGLYATSARQDILREEPLPGVTAVSVTTGTGMTVGLGLGARTVASWEGVEARRAGDPAGR